MIADGQRWQLVQYHFHSPSEHSIGGWRADMELHLVHKSLATGEPAVVCSPDNMSQNAKQGPLPYSSWQTMNSEAAVYRLFNKGFHDHAAGQLGVVGILLQAVGAGDGEQGCSALNQALTMVPTKVGSTSGAIAT